MNVSDVYMRNSSNYKIKLAEKAIQYGYTNGSILY